jgi:hypothetical protein
MFNAISRCTKIIKKNSTNHEILEQRSEVLEKTQSLKYWQSEYLQT